jgi:hypothetical protein
MIERNRKRQDKRMWMGLAVGLLLALAAPASAVPVVYTVSDGGIDQAAGCTGLAILCPGFAAIAFEQDPSGAIPELASGTYTLDEMAGTLDVALSVSSLTMTATGAAVNGVDEVVFSGLTYTGMLAVTGAGDGPYNVTLPDTLTVSGSYTQLLGGAGVVGATPFSLDVDVTAGQCLINAGNMTCGLFVGADLAGSAFTLGIGVAPTPVNFQHVFNTVAVPEPGTALLLGLALALVSTRRR